jgi:hypothetical protein
MADTNMVSKHTRSRPGTIERVFRRDTHAREIQAHTLADELLEISDDGSNDWMERKGKDERGGWELNGENIQRSRVRIDTRKWLLSKMLPKVYGDKTEVAVTGANGGPLQTVSATVEIPANDPIEAARVYQKLMSGD